MALRGIAMALALLMLVGFGGEALANSPDVAGVVGAAPGRQCDQLACLKLCFLGGAVPTVGLVCGVLRE